MDYTYVSKMLLPLRRMFYFVTPAETTYKSLESIPNFVAEAIPFFLLLLIIEFSIIFRKKSKYTGIDWSDSISSISAGIISQVPLFFFKSAEILIFIWVHKHYRIIEVDQNSPAVWFGGMIGVDFGYYWVHRAGHEISLFWSTHQAHHSSQRYNLSTALRQGLLQRYFAWMFYLPLALFLPPTVFVVHLQFNLLYQFWIHTEVINKLGPIEWIFNTPSHHRVHHGRNKYCIDKNYGGTLIIFDRLFGTFQKEEDNVIYGIVQPIKTWNPLKIQIIYLKHLYHKVSNQTGVLEKCKAIFYGPGWEKDQSRLGSVDSISEPEKPVEYYKKEVSSSIFIYCFINFIATNLSFSILLAFEKSLTNNILIISAGMILFTLLQIGRLLDAEKPFWSESLRIAIIFGIIMKFFCS